MYELLREIKIVLMDIDGTLIRGPEDAIENVLAQLRRLKRVGVRFSVATGRTLFGANRIVKDMSRVGMNMPPVIAYNGAVVALPDEGAVLHRQTLDPDALATLFKAFKQHGVVPLVYACGEGFDHTPAERVYCERTELVGVERDFNGMEILRIDRIDQVETGDVVAVLGQRTTPGEDIRELSERLANELGEYLRITTSGGHYIEVAHPSSTKANAMAVLTRYWGVQPREVMAIGDNFNDIEMLAAAGLGVAVANAPAGVRAAARYVCRLEGAAGVVESLRMLLAAVRQNRIELRAQEEQ